jgi:hypothetical protein
MNLFSSELDEVQFLFLISIEDSDFFETGVNSGVLRDYRRIHGGRV